MTENVLHKIIALGFGWREILVILVIALLILGGKKLPEFAKGLAKALRIFKKELHDADETKDEIVNDVKDAAGLNETEQKD